MGTVTALGQRIRKGRALLNAVLALRKAAEATQHGEHKRRLYWRAARVLKQYLKEKLYESDARKASVHRSVKDFDARVGYGQLQLVPSNEDTFFLIKGYQQVIQAKGAWQGRLLPGTYEITATAPGGRTKNKTVLLRPKSKQSLRFSFPVRKKSMRWVTVDKHKGRRLAGIVLMVVGGASVLVGGIAWGIAGAAELEIQELVGTWEDGLSFLRRDTSTLSDAQETRDDLWVPGVLVTLSGALLVGTGALLYAYSRPSRKKTVALNHAKHRDVIMVLE